jgi:hypothetical protein
MASGTWIAGGTAIGEEGVAGVGRAGRVRDTGSVSPTPSWRRRLAFSLATESSRAHLSWSSSWS